MTIERFLVSIVLGMALSWATMHAGFNLYTAASYILKGYPNPWTAWLHLGLTTSIIAYLLTRLSD